MRIIRFDAQPYVPASHEDAAKPGVLKKIMCGRDDLAAGRVQMINWALLGPGKAFQAHYHEDMQEIFVITAGTAHMTVGSETAILAPGDAVVVPEQAVHVMENRGAEDVRYVVVGVAREAGGRTVVV